MRGGWKSKGHQLERRRGRDEQKKMTGVKVTMIMDSITEHLNMKREEKKRKKTCRLSVQHKPQMQLSMDSTG